MVATRAGDAAADELARITHEPGSHVAGRIRNVVGFYWLKSNSLPAVELLNQLCEEVSNARKKPFSAIHVVRADIGLPNGEVRQALAASMKKYADVSCCLAVVTLGAGFWVSALQGAITGIRMLAPVGNSILRFVPKPEDLQGWFVDEHMARSSESIDDASLVKAIQRLRQIGDAPEGAAVKD